MHVPGQRSKAGAAMPDTNTFLRRSAAAEAAQTEPALTEMYGENFYERYLAVSIQSARIYLKYLWQFFQPVSVLDVGCGRGAWLKACRELGSTTLLGFDGGLSNQSSMIDSAINFHGINLNEAFSVPYKVDLAMTLEVAEHLQPATAPFFVKLLTDAADAVLFSAAYTKQGGTYHINEQPHTFWAKLFAEHGFVPFDLFRPLFWGNEDVCFWYRQNVFAYVKRNSPVFLQLASHGFRELADISFMDCIHPDLYRSKTLPPSVRDHIVDLMPSVWRAIRRRLR